MDVLLGHHIGSPGGHTAGAVVHGTEYLGSGWIGIGLDTIMAGDGSGERHFGVDGDTAVQLAIAHHLPLAAFLADLDDGAAMGCHFDIDLVLAERRKLERLLAVLLHHLDDAGEHQMRVGVFVVDHQKPVLGRTFQRDVTDEIVVVAELPGLRRGGLPGRIEVRCVGEQWITPAQQHVGIVTGGDMVLVVNAGLDFVEGESRTAPGRARLVGAHQGKRADGDSNSGNRKRAFEKATARKTRGDDLAHGAVVGRVDRRTFVFFKQAGAEADVFVVRHD